LYFLWVRGKKGERHVCPRGKGIFEMNGKQLSRRPILLLAAATALLAPRAWAAPVTDAKGRQVTADDVSRLVCIGGTITEILYALGAGDKIVAVDSTSQYPAAALHDKRDIGYMRMVSPEGVLSVGPSLILAMADSGPPQALAILEASPVPVILVDATPSPQAVLSRIRFLAGVLGDTARGEQLCQTVQMQFAHVTSWRNAHPGGQRVLFVLSMQNGRPLVAGTGTAADAIITLPGGVNAAAAVRGYKPVGDETLITFAPDVVLAMDHAGPSIEASDLDRPGFRMTKAGANHALIRMDGEFLLGFGPRTPDAALQLAKQLAAYEPA
jgi:iron complex transport system substrate-binding protein